MARSAAAGSPQIPMGRSFRTGRPGSQHHQLADSTTYDVPSGASSSYGAGHDGDVASWAWPNNGRSRAKIVLSRHARQRIPRKRIWCSWRAFISTSRDMAATETEPAPRRPSVPIVVTTIDVPATSRGWKLNVETNNHMVDNGASCLVQLDGATRNVSFHGASTEVFSAIPSGRGALRQTAAAVAPWRFRGREKTTSATMTK